MPAWEMVNWAAKWNDLRYQYSSDQTLETGPVQQTLLKNINPYLLIIEFSQKN